MAEEQVGDDDAFLYGGDAEQEAANREVDEVEAATGGGTTDESRPVRCNILIFLLIYLIREPSCQK